MAGPSFGSIGEFLATIGFKTDTSSLKDALGKIVGFAAAAKGAALGIMAGTQKVADSFVSLSQEALRARVSVEEMSRLKYMAEATGTPLDKLTEAFEKLVDQNPELKNGAVALETVSEKLKGMSTEAQHAYLKMLDIDESVLPLLIADTAELKNEFSAMYGVAGFSVAQAVDTSKQFLAQITRLKTMVLLLVQSVAVPLMDKLKTDIEGFRRMLTDNFGKIRMMLAGIVNIILRVSGVITSVLNRFFSVISAAIGWFDKLSATSKKIILIVGAFIVAWKKLNLAFLASPLGLLISALIGLYLLLDDFLTYLEGGQSLIDWGPWKDDILAVGAALREAGEAAIQIFTSLAPAAKVALGVVVSVLAVAGRIILQLVSWFAEFFNGLSDGWKKVIVGLGLLTIGLIKFFPIFKALAVGIKLVMIAWRALSLAFIASPIGLIITAVVAVVAGLVLLIKDLVDYLNGKDSWLDWGPFIAGVKAVGAVLKAVFGVAIDLAKSWFKTLKEYIAFIGHVFATLGKVIVAIFNGDFKQVFDLLKGLGSDCVNFFTGLFTSLASKILSAGMAIWNTIKENFPNFAALLENSLGKIINFFNDLHNKFVSWATGVVDSIKNIFTAGIKFIRDKISGMLNLLPSGLSSMLGLSEAGNAAQAVNGGRWRGRGRGAGLTPAPSKGVALGGGTTNTSNIQQSNQVSINVSAPDPVAAGQQVANRQKEVNAQASRNLMGAAS